MSASVQFELIRNASEERIEAYCANPPLHSEPTVQAEKLFLFFGTVCIVLTITRSPILLLSTELPTATIIPHISAPCIIGKFRGFPDQLPSSAFSTEDFEYQPVLVLISVLLIPAPLT